jgi:uncharacterized protein YndB with AHSA1/START domain
MTSGASTGVTSYTTPPDREVLLTRVVSAPLLAPPERLVTTESWGPGWPETVNTLVLTESEGRTTIALTITYVSKEARDTALATGAMDGMNRAFELLDELLELER